MIVEVKYRYKLNHELKQTLKSMEPEFGFNGLGEVVFRRTYSRDNEDWADVVIRVIEGVITIRKNHYYKNGIEWNEKEWDSIAEKMALSMFKMEWLPPGRGLWMMGTPFVYERGAMALYNCFDFSTEFWTDKGLKKFSDFNDGDVVTVRGKNKWVDAKVKCFGKDRLWKLVVRKGSEIREIMTTENHRWNVKNKKCGSYYKENLLKTKELYENLKLVSFAKRTNVHCLQICGVGIQHGIVFGDGTKSSNKYNNTITGLPSTWKQLPSLDMNKEYLLGFIAGWFATDGHIGKNSCMSISNKDKDVLQGLRDILFKLDITTGKIRLTRTENPFTGEQSPLYSVSINRKGITKSFFIRDDQRERFSNCKEMDWRVVSVEPTDKIEDVWCVVEPSKEEFTLECGILTKNCSATDSEKDFVQAAHWGMDCLMNGVGVGFNTNWKGKVSYPNKSEIKKVVIEDSREGWIDSVATLMRSFVADPETGRPQQEWFPEFDYSKIRKQGEKIKGFGGTASGSKPLQDLHERIERYFMDFLSDNPDYTHSRLVADVFNAIGACVVAGNVRRSAEICLGSADDTQFMNLKNYEKHPERMEIGWLSNNSVLLKDTPTNEVLKEMAQRISDNGEPGMLNLANAQRYGRMGEDREDKTAILTNPCGEISLADKETCNLSEIFPTRCYGPEEFFNAIRYATLYSSTVALLPTHRRETNNIIMKNRRIGVSISGIAQWASGFNKEGWSKNMNYSEISKYLDSGYKIVRSENKRLARDAGVPESIRVTTIKPSGTISLLAGVTPGIHFPVSRYAIRRIRVGTHSPIIDALLNSNVPREDDQFSANTKVFEFIIDHGPVRPCEEVSPWEQFALIRMVQKYWADNSVSATVYFDKESCKPEEIQKMLDLYIPELKSVSMLPHSGHGYVQAPYEPLTEEEYNKRVEETKIDFSNTKGNVPSGSVYCTGDNCVRV